jgi:hypothetical protein
MQSEEIRVIDNVVDGTKYGGIFVIGHGHTITGNRLTRLNMAGCNESHRHFGCIYNAEEPEILQTGIYLGKKAERPAPHEQHDHRQHHLRVQDGRALYCRRSRAGPRGQHHREERVQEPIDVGQRMRAEWNERAREDAHYYVAFGRRDQDDDEFFATAKEIVVSLEAELRRFPPDSNRRAWRALEIGCGPGRLMKPMSRHFGEIHGVDVSDE